MLYSRMIKSNSPSERILGWFIFQKYSKFIIIQEIFIHTGKKWRKNRDLPYLKKSTLKPIMCSYCSLFLFLLADISKWVSRLFISIGLWEEIGAGEKFSSKKGKIVKEVGSVRYNKNKSVENKQTDNWEVVIFK